MESDMAGRPTAPPGPLLVPAGIGEVFDTGRLITEWKINGTQTGGRFSVIQHQLPPRTLAAPLHRYHREDEYSYVLAGTFGALLGEDVVKAQPGAWVFKPRGQWHTFWNAGNTVCEIVEIISPAGFEEYFRELSAIMPDRTKATSTLRKYQIDMDFDSIPLICARFGLM